MANQRSITDNETDDCRNCGEKIFRYMGRDLEWLPWRHAGLIFNPVECLNHSGSVAAPVVPDEDDDNPYDVW